MYNQLMLPTNREPAFSLFTVCCGPMLKRLGPACIAAPYWSTLQGRAPLVAAYTTIIIRISCFTAYRNTKEPWLGPSRLKIALPTLMRNSI